MNASVYVPVRARALTRLDDVGRCHLIATWRELDSRAHGGRAFAVLAGLLVAMGAFVVTANLGAIPLGVATTLCLNQLSTWRKERAFRSAARELGLDDADAWLTARRLARVDLLSFPDDEGLMRYLTAA